MKDTANAAAAAAFQDTSAIEATNEKMLQAYLADKRAAKAVWRLSPT